MELIREFAAFIWQRKLWWLAPIIFVLLALGALIVFAEGSSLAPFIYPIL